MKVRDRELGEQKSWSPRSHRTSRVRVPCVQRGSRGARVRSSREIHYWYNVCVWRSKGCAVTKCSICLLELHGPCGQVLKEAIESNGGTVDEVSPFRNVALVGSKKEVSSREVLDALLLDPRILTVYPNCITRAYNGDR